MASDPSTSERDPTPAEARVLLEAERSGAPFLYWHTAEGAQRLRPLEADRWRVTVGRNADADVALVWDLEVSRTHALLELVGEEWTVVDDGLSRNGSYVNGKRVSGRHRLHDGDRLCFGRTVVMYREPRVNESEASTARVQSGSANVYLTAQQRKVLIALCRPVMDSSSATPATNRQIADEVYLSVDAVKAHLRILFDRFGFGDLPQNEKRARLAARALMDGIVKPHDF
jgi:pSer/pThr/pTyr-binding forkhead associated (FHA) protein